VAFLFASSSTLGFFHGWEMVVALCITNLNACIWQPKMTWVCTGNPQWEA